MKGQPAAESICQDERVAYKSRSSDSMAEDVEHVVPVVGKSKRMDDGVELDDRNRENKGSQDANHVEQGRPSGGRLPGHCKNTATRMDKEGQDRGNEEGSRKKGKERPDIEHLG